MDNNIIVVGGIHHNILGVLRALGKMNLKDRMYVVITKTDTDFVTATKYVKSSNVYYVDSDEKIVDALMNLRHINGSKPVVICCSDASISIIDKNYNKLSQYFILPNANNMQGEITRLMNKEVQMHYAKNNNIDIPKSLTVSRDDIVNTDWDIYPCIIKPLDSIIGSKLNIHICKNREELINNIITSDCKRYQIQEYIERDFEFQLIGCSMSAGERVIIPGFTKLIRQPNNTNTGYLRYSHYSKLDFNYSIAEKFVKDIGYSGLFSLEFLRGKDGKNYFMEINMRNDGNGYCVTEFGINLPYVWYIHCIGKYFDIPEINSEASVLFMPELNDIKNVKSVGIFKWLQECFSADCHATFKLNDPLPFIFQLSSMVKGKIKRIFINSK